MLVAGVALTNLASCNSSDQTNYRDDYRSACKDGNFQAAHDILDNLHQEFIEIYSDNYGDLEYDNDKRAKIEAAATKYSTAAKYILTTEARFLVDENPDETPKAQLTNLFLELQPIGKKLADGTEYHPGGVKYLQQNCANINCYIEYVNANNALADLLMSLSQATDNPELAKIARLHYLDEPYLVREGYDDVLRYRTPEKPASLNSDDDGYGF